jgi:hypothetical protein
MKHPLPSEKTSAQNDTRPLFSTPLLLVISASIGILQSTFSYGSAIANPQELFMTAPHEAMTPYEKNLVSYVESTGGQVYENELRAIAGTNARGFRLKDSSSAVIDSHVKERKYGISLDGTDTTLIQGFSFYDRVSTDIYGSGIVVGSTTPPYGETYISNVYLDLKEDGPNNDYSQANNEPISIERNSPTVNIRKAVLVNGQDAGIDNKSVAYIDSSFIASGGRTIRIWDDAEVVIANSIILAYPDNHAIWLGGTGSGVARLSYYNCLFGYVGSSPDTYVDTLPDAMVSVYNNSAVEIVKLEEDPFDRAEEGFWTNPRMPLPPVWD